MFQERYSDPELSTLVPQHTVTYTRGTDLSGELQSAGGIGGLLARSDSALLFGGSPSGHAYYHADGNWNVTCLINLSNTIVAQYQYDPFGNSLWKSGSLAAMNVYRFSSKEWHEKSGLSYYLFRFYEPTLQHWLNKDPLGDSSSLAQMTASITPNTENGNLIEKVVTIKPADGSLADVRSLDEWTDVNANLYDSAGNNLVSRVDIWGLCADDPNLQAAQKALQATAERLKQANDAVKAEELGSKARELATEQARKLMEEYEIRQARLAELRQALNESNPASGIWPKVGRFFKAFGRALITIPARIPLMLLPVWDDPNYCRDNMAAIEQTSSGETASDSQKCETRATAVEKADQNSNTPSIQTWQTVDAESASPLLVSAK